MKTTLMMATSLNGYITGKDDDTSWIKDFGLLYKAAADYGIVVMGRRTYDECVKYDAFPYKGAVNIVMTHDKRLISKTTGSEIFTDLPPKGVLLLAQEKGFSKVLLIGGGHLNASFLKDWLVDEMIIDVHPILIHGGIRLFEGVFDSQKLEFVSVGKVMDDIIQVRYAVKR
jgi:dihydrofolate reductase